MANMKAAATKEIKTAAAATATATAAKATAKAKTGSRAANRAAAANKAKAGKPAANRAAASKAKTGKAATAASSREVVNKVQPTSAQPANKNAKPSKTSKAGSKAKTSSKATGAPAITTKNDKIDKQYGVGKLDTLPTEYQKETASERVARAFIDDEKGQFGWQQLSKYYGWSIVPLVAELVKEGKWPTMQKTNKDGVVKDENNAPVLVPVPYKEVYKNETTPGVGHHINRAANRFSEYKPDALKSAGRQQQNQPKPGDKNYQPGSQPRKTKSSFDLACDYVAGMTPDQVKRFIANDFVNDALREYLDPKHQKPLAK